MAEPGLKRRRRRGPKARAIIGGTVLAAASAACSGSPAPTATTATPPPSPSSVDATSAVTTDARGWGKYHSKRFAVTVPLPDGKGWKIDDHRGPSLVATHALTSSRLELITTQEDELMNRQRCEERAKRLGWLENASRFTTVEDEVQVGPDAYDSRVWVALDPGSPSAQTSKVDGVGGHVFLFGAFLRRCLLVHYSTSVASAKEEEQLATRLAVASARIVKGITIDPLRTTDEATVPRDKPNVRR